MYSIEYINSIHELIIIVKKETAIIYMLGNQILFFWNGYILYSQRIKHLSCFCCNNYVYFRKSEELIDKGKFLLIESQILNLNVIKLLDLTTH